MSRLVDVWGGSKSQIADKVRQYADKTDMVPSYIMLHLLHEATVEITELENVPTVENFREWMVSKMHEREITGKELAGKAGISETTVASILKGRNSPTLRTACSIAEVLR